MATPTQRTYRRRRAVAGAAALVLLAAAATGLESALGGPNTGPGPGTIEQHYLNAVPERSLIAQRLMVSMDGTATPELVRQAKRGEIGGVIVFPGVGQPAEDVGKQVARLARAARRGGQPPLLVATDQEGGEIKRFPEGPPGASPAELGASGKPAAARKAGRETGRYLDGLGINVDLAPVLDVPTSDLSFMSSRAFARDANTVGKVGVAFARGLERGGVVPTAKHFPGLGRAIANTDLERSEIDASESDLDQDLIPFRDAIAAGLPMIMVGSAVYTALDPDAPAALSKNVVDGLLRDRLGFKGVVISDDLQAGAVQQAADESEAAIDAAGAGVDVLLFANTNDAAAPAKALRKAAKGGELDRDELEQSFKRVIELKDSLGSGR